MMDRLTIAAAEAAYHPGCPEGAQAVLLVELDGIGVQVVEDEIAVEKICRGCGAFEIRIAQDEAERALLWKGTGEHGVGVDKACSMPQMFSERDLETFGRLRRAFDPDGLANPGKVLPTPRLCGEVPGPYRMHPLERIGVAERF